MASSFSFDSLNKAQREAVGAVNGPVLILAGAGTGKTRTVTCRIANMLERGVDAKNVLAVTFTNKAAAEMKERIGGMVSKQAAEEMTVCTFHSLCVRILRNGIDRLGYKKNFAIYTGSDQVSLIKQIMVRKGGANSPYKPQEILSVISKSKNDSSDNRLERDEFMNIVATAYQNELRAQNAVDFDDLLVLTEKLLTEHEDIRQYCRELYQRVTVDEFQDTNALQMRLLQQLVGPPYHVCVVGDDDQSIYGWRGAEVANILQFENFFPNPKIILLEENYRSTNAVLHTANSLIKHNVGRRAKVLVSTRAGGAPVRIVSMPGDEEEAEFIAEEIIEEKNLLKRPWEDFAILFRTNTQCRKLEESLRARKIPYRMIGAQSFFDRREIRDVIAYAQLMLAPDADVALLRVLNAPQRGIGQKTAVLATDYSREKNKSVWEALCDPEFTSTIGAKTRAAIEEFVAMISHAKARVDVAKENAGTVLREMIAQMDYVAWLMRGSQTEKERDMRREGIGSIIQQLEDYSARGKSLQKFLDAVSLSSEREEDLESKQGVTLITLHASKGLEFPHVYLVGLEEGTLPHKRSISEGTRDEERRLLYVGITRAREKLTLTYCASRKKYGETVLSQPSTFLDELDPEFIEITSYDEIFGREASEDELSSFFDSMKDLLG
jgi:DNA helicase-2/ATP-dependent DNA helicase PcrA